MCFVCVSVCVRVCVYACMSAVFLFYYEDNLKKKILSHGEIFRLSLIC